MKRTAAAAPAGADTIARLERVIHARLAHPARESYIATLAAGGEDAVLRKVGEEATELILAVKGGDSARILDEAADLWFHTLVLLAQQGLSATAVAEVLAQRMGRSGLAEQAGQSARRDSA